MPASVSNWSFSDFIMRAPSAIAMFDDEMRYIAVSLRFLADFRLLSESQHSVVGRSLYDVLSDIPERCRDMHRRVLGGEMLSGIEDWSPRADGTRDGMSWGMGPWRHPDGTIGGAVIFAEPGTGRKETEAALAASESLLRLSQEAAHIGSYDWHIGGGPNIWSDEHCRLFGIEPSGGRSIPIEVWRDIIHPDDLPTVEQRIAEIIETGGSGEIEHRIRTPSGVRWLYGRGQLVREKGKPTRLIGINMDITERRILQDELRELTRTLEKRVEQEVLAREAAQTRLAHAQKLQSIGELTGGVAHDFNNLLTVVTGTIDILAEGVADRPALAAIVKMIGLAADRGAKLTSNLLAFARKQPLRPRSTDVEALIATAGDLLASALGRQIEINCIKRGYVGTVMVDPDQLTSAIVNLGINARDAMPNGGSLTIDADTVAIDQDEAAVRDIAAGNYVIISVTDTGTGIDEDIQDKIYEPFFSTKGVGKGTGLGLSMVHGFIKQSGGNIEFETARNKGTTFRLYLPSSGESAVPQAVDLAYNRLVGGQETILCVEDDPIVREFVTRQLQALGYKTIAASNATEALAEVRSNASIDLLFTDVIMPGKMDGWKLAELVKQARPEIKIVCTTGYSSFSSERIGSDPGILLLEKPYRLSALALMVRRALEGPAPKSAN
jgi:PAS domain S-box-containing protein